MYKATTSLCNIILYNAYIHLNTQGRQTCPARGKGSLRTPTSNRLNQDGGYELSGCWIMTMKKLGGGGNHACANCTGASASALNCMGARAQEPCL